MAKPSRPLMYGLLLVVVAASVVFLQGGDSPRKSSNKKSTLSASAKNKSTDFTEEDYTATFASSQLQARNIFMPLIVRSSLRAGLGPTGPINVPTELTMGEQNWVYTGMAEVDSVPTALLENTATQDGVFLKQGERWKEATVYQITPDVLVLLGPDGLHHEIKVLGSEEPIAPAPGAGFKPLSISPTPGLQGPIGGGNIQVQPTRGGARAPGVTNVPNFN